MFTSYTKREIRHFHAAVVRAKKCTKQRDAHVQSCCFANLNLLLFAVLAALAVIA